MKICPKCKEEHEKSGVYCSRTCANSRKFTEETRKKKSLANKKYWNSLTDDDKKLKGKILQEQSPYNSENYFKSLMTQEWAVIGIQGKRLRVILEQSGHCKKCGIDEWNGKLITLEYEHKDGNNENNDRNNVEALCPNCHSQTPTWRGRKNGSGRSRASTVKKYLILQKEIDTEYQKVT